MIHAHSLAFVICIVIAATIFIVEYARSRALYLIGLAVLAIALITGCTQVPLVVSTGVTDGLYFGVKDPVQRKKVACNITSYSATLSAIAAVPDPAGLHSLLEQYLPASDVKEITAANVTTFYAVYYPTIKDKAPAEQLSAFKTWVDAANTGASVWCK